MWGKAGFECHLGQSTVGRMCGIHALMMDLRQKRSYGYVKVENVGENKLDYDNKQRFEGACVMFLLGPKHAQLISLLTYMYLEASSHINENVR